ncbi:putative disease resistance rpp13-like protein 1 [Phtheirospermum japonicum]|uniref:Putative disease resistance rpp13-like protein 1 n=1 Tax=Phtheirospermum japonicum TaxID=374723 RepID=A0A830C0B3_9LAMI|nr:putative disease resistance rpp13-like protein 1 [Phtheirospermum japonicum]
MAVGELFLSAFVQVLFQQLASAATMALARREKVEGHFKKLSHSLLTIQAVLDDAEEKQLTDKSVKLWLESLRDLAYDLDDLLDEIMTRAEIQNSEDTQNCRTSRVWRFIPTCSSYMPGALVSNYRLMSRIKETNNKLKYIVDQRTGLKLSENSGSSCNRSSVIRLPSTSLVNESQVYGRDEDKETIIEMSLGNEVCRDDLSVIPIVGMGGIGKTTLAQLVYNDRTVKQNFHVRAWVCVTEDFDVVSITKTIYESVTGISGQSKDLEMLQVSLKDKLAKSKFLIVLDDVWNEDYVKWDDLCRPFQFGLPGSRIIVTTRNDSVASVVGSPLTAYHIKLLTDEDCLSLLAQHARTSFQDNAELREVGLGLAKKCKGLPLAAKTLGGLLRSKETKEEWEKVLSSKIWDLPEQNNILPVLRLSYHHLPSHLKHLFSYCSIFPKDYEFDKTELVLLWMGEGFLEQPNPRVRKEELGLEYFNELLSRSFFQRLSSSDSCFVMHDLINDLAQFVAGSTCYRLDEKMDTSQEYRVPEKARHGSFLRHEYEVFRKFYTFNQVQGLRTFLPMPVQNSQVWPPFYLSNRILVELVPKLNSLRVLSLSGYSITELPSSICNLLHLRYLNLSGTSIVTLPDTLSDLFHLQTLSLRNCRFISKLPPTLGKLSSLRHLDNSDTDQLKDMPVEIGNLRNLQTLPKIVLGKDGGLGLKELRDLRYLRGTLAVFELQNVTDIEDVKEANLRCKNELDELQLSWGSELDNSNSCPVSEEDVIDNLQPHENLKNLKIEFYRGSGFPIWIGDPAFRKLSSLSFTSCLGCSSLPPLGQLPELKHLRIGGMPKVKRVGIEFYGEGVTIPFPKLETLRFDNLPEWKKWTGFSDGKIDFPHLQHLAVFRCDKLTEVSPLSFPALRALDIEECDKVLLESFLGLNSLNYLKVEAITGLSHLPTELMQSLKSLEVLECCSCNELLSLWPDENIPRQQHLAHLRRLVVADCSQLVSLGHGEQQLPCNLQVLELFRCANLVSLPNDLGDVGSLRELIIKNCIKFVSFPENGIPPMLKRLEIMSCNALESLPFNIYDLERLEIKECPSLRTWTCDNFPTALKKLAIKNCAQLEPVTDTMFPDNNIMLLEDISLCNWLNFSNLLQRLNGFSHVVELYLSSCNRLRHFPEHGLPPGLRALSIEDCASLKTLPAKIRTMRSLVSLELRSCPRLDNFPKCDLPPNLTSLRIWDSKKFKPLTKWGLHRLGSLREFSICGGFKELEVLGEDDCLFPPSLIKFSIARFPKLTSLGKVLENLTLLRHLSIMNCQNLNVLPTENLLEKLWHLEISDCPLLKQRCLKDRGDYWGKIAGIPCVEIDGTYVYKQNSV